MKTKDVTRLLVLIDEYAVAVSNNAGWRLGDELEELADNRAALALARQALEKELQRHTRRRFRLWGKRPTLQELTDLR